MKTKAAFAALAIITAAPQSHAAIVLSGNFNTGTPTPTLTITEDIVFSITAPGNVFLLVFNNWIVSDGTQTDVGDIPQQSLAYILNGNGGALSILTLGDNFQTASGDYDTNDGYVALSETAVTNGDAFTVLAGAYTFGNHTNFNPLLAGKTFTGNVFLTNGVGARLSDIVAVPEPSTLVLSVLGLLPLLRRKR